MWERQRREESALLLTELVRAACNLIPQATQTFRGALGATNRPYAAPGDFVEVAVQPSRCDVASPRLTTDPSDYVVTVVFTPPNNGQRRVAFLTSGSCADPDSIAKRQGCEAVPMIGSGNVACIDTLAGMSIVDRDGVRNLSFRFPDTDALYQLPNDDRTLSGPVAIAVSSSAPGTPPPCRLAQTACGGFCATSPAAPASAYRRYHA